MVKFMKSYCFVLLLCVLFLAGCSAPVQGLSHYNRGVEYYSTGQTDLAEQQYRLAIKENPELAEAYLNLGLLYLEDGWLEGAENQTLTAIQLLEKNRKTVIEGATVEETLSIAYNNLGAVEIGRCIELEMRSDYDTAHIHWEKAMAYFSKAISLDPNNSRAQANIQMFGNAY